METVKRFFNWAWMCSVGWLWCRHNWVQVDRLHTHVYVERCPICDSERRVVRF